MNPEIKSIIEEMNRRVIGQPTHPADVQNFMSVKMATVLALIAEEQGESAKKLERQTNKLIWLTRAIVGLTVALLFFTIILYQDTHKMIHGVSQTDPHTAEKN